jgi:hypothetical protein
MDVCCLCTYEDSEGIPPSTIYKRGEEGKREWKYNGGVNLFKLLCTHIWNYNKNALVLLMYKKSNIYIHTFIKNLKTKYLYKYSKYYK